MNDRDKLNYIFDYLEAFEEDLWIAFLNGSEVTRPFINAKQSVIDEIIDYIECVTGERVRISNEYLYEGE